MHREAVRIGSRSIVASVILTMLLPPSTLSASAQSVADFYKGKSINLIIASAEGGGYDISARLIAAHLSKFVPGHPVIVPRNMAGASGMQAVDYVQRGHAGRHRHLHSAADDDFEQGRRP
jgi:tripartite-type tricarboxylate transporter receptor subunit TctC